MSQVILNFGKGRMILLLVLLLCWPADAQQRKQTKEAEPVATETEIERITVEELKRKLDAKEKIVIIDARDGRSYIGSSVKIKGARHITVGQIEEKLKTLPKNREIIVYCT